MSSRSVVGAVLMVIGTLAFLLAITPSTPMVTRVALAPAVLILALGTYMVGTDMDGRPV
jgi:hypothetical protein